MRIGHLTTFCQPLWGGQEVYVNNLYQVLQEEGFEQRIYQFDTGIDRPHIVNLPALKWLRKKIGLGLAFNLVLLSKLNQLQQEEVLIVHYPIHYFPVFWHPNKIVLTHGVTWDCNRGAKKIIKKRIDSLAFSASEKFVANDSFYFREMGLAAPPGNGLFSEIADNRWIIPNCVDVERFVRIEPDKKLSRQQAILLPRNWTFPRGIHLAVLAFAKFVQRFPDTKLALAGEVFEFVRKAGAYKNYINRLIVDFHLTDKILFLGRVPWQQMPRIYSSVQMTLIPSLGVEGTSLSALESMACGTATISTDRGGLADLPTEQCPADENSLAEKMIDVYLRRQEIGQRQQAVVANRFNLDNWKKAWLNVILK